MTPAGRLDRIVRLREDEEEKARKEWAQRLQVADSAHELVESLKKRLDRSAAAAQTAGLWEIHEAAEHRLRLLIRKATEMLAKALEAAERSRLEHVASRQRTEVVRRVADVRREERRAEDRRLENRRMDEVGMMLFARRE